MPLKRKLLAATLLSAVWLVPTVPAAYAQAQAPSQPAPSAKAKEKAKDLSDNKLDAVAAALGQVATLQENYQQKIESAPPSDKERIAGEANNALTKAVTDQGLSVDEYTEILVVAQNDPTLREKILQRVRSSTK
ncbi:DUF4168 domain-containing protein [Bradyrhizobium sp. LHD-71]|uniref:DUF4168 domain-containing protein n=1 Tax=Bradyrhizobium sp. LHD-71 TaxID=3072141 RepID=UPI00280C7073|nr:DUF4168 domain-containing protein [Bradyrhizobium sp. LHD-71]MDQ8730062.1 DUF4168 domain-containing protein [Bradyrhizobium sp. LHD-71]